MARTTSLKRTVIPFAICALASAALVLSQTLTCPDVDPTQSGACVELCTADTNCTAREKCCSNGCGHSCVTGVENKSGSGKGNKVIPNSGLFIIDDVYVVLIGMGVMVILLFLIIVITLCVYGRKKKERNMSDF